MPKFLTLAAIALTALVSQTFAQDASVNNGVLRVVCRPGVDETIVVRPGNTYTPTGRVERIVVNFSGRADLSFDPVREGINSVVIEGNTGWDDLSFGVNSKGQSLFDAFNLVYHGLSGGGGVDLLDPGPDADSTVSIQGGDEGDYIVRYIGYRNGRLQFTPGAEDFNSREGDKYIYEWPKLR